jgi:hypothetical protein
MSWQLTNMNEAERREYDARMGRLAAGWSRQRRRLFGRATSVRPQPVRREVVQAMPAMYSK